MLNSKPSLHSKHKERKHSLKAFFVKTGHLNKISFKLSRFYLKRASYELKKVKRHSSIKQPNGE